MPPNKGCSGQFLKGRHVKDVQIILMVECSKMHVRNLRESAAKEERQSTELHPESVASLVTEFLVQLEELIHHAVNTTIKLCTQWGVKTPSGCAGSKGREVSMLF